jgi:hypothetical protein
MKGIVEQMKISKESNMINSVNEQTLKMIIEKDK